MLTPRVVKPLYKKTRKALKSFLRPYRVSTQFSYNEYAIKCADNIMLTLKNMNNLFAQLKKFVRKTGKVYIKPTTIIPITKKASETRMGSGVGKIDHWETRIQAGSILLEFSTLLPHNDLLRYFLYFNEKSKVKLKLLWFRGFIK